MQHFTLDLSDPKAIPKHEPNIERWARWFDKTDRTIKRDEVAGCAIVTTFIGIAEHEPFDEQPLFESMVCDLESIETLVGAKIELNDWNPRRSLTREAAESAHMQLVTHLTAIVEAKHKVDAAIKAERVSPAKPCEHAFAGDSDHCSRCGVSLKTLREKDNHSPFLEGLEAIE